MSGFSAITAANGWLIAALGISVVFFGLASLAFIITYFPRVIDWWNAHARTPKSIVPMLKSVFSHSKEKEPIISIAGESQSQEPWDLEDAEEALRLLTAHMGEPFKLPRLIEVAEQRGLAKVYSIINRMLMRGTMVGGPDGLFRWATPNEKERQVESKFKESK
jgi:Na+-transporting methylmalonyl-CoA/oxaloacetate decarboxylase gamma subunit